MGKTGHQCVFFDRDGIVNESPGPLRYVTRWEDFHIIPAFIDSLRIASRLGYHAAIATNQRAVAKGLMTIEQLEDMHRRLARILAETHALHLLDIAFCPHDENECSCRKPRPGMLLEMARKHDINLGASWMIGDAETDVEAGRNAGCRTIIVGTAVPESKADLKVSSMCDLPRLLDSILRPGSSQCAKK